MLGGLFHAFVRKMDSSRNARFCLFAALGLFVLLACFPPSTWGRWYLYEKGVASHYGDGFYFRKTSSGEFLMPFSEYTAGHRSLPLGTVVLVKNKRNGRTVVVRINDRGPFHEGRTIDLCTAAARKIGMLDEGVIPVEIYTRKKLR